MKCMAALLWWRPLSREGAWYEDRLLIQSLDDVLIFSPFVFVFLPQKIFRLGWWGKLCTEYHKIDQRSLMSYVATTRPNRERTQ